MLGRRTSAATRISIGLVGLTITLLFTAEFLGLLPDDTHTVLDSRKRLCETIAVDWSLAPHDEDFSVIQTSATALTQRNPDILSMGLRGADSELLVEAGDHRRHWTEGPEGSQGGMQAVVPIYRLPGDKAWAQVEIRFRPLNTGAFLRPAGLPVLGAALFIAVTGFVVFRLYIGRTFQHLDPATVVPERVKGALNVMSEGVVLVDGKERIVLANDEFAGALGVPADELQGRRLSGLQWVNSSLTCYLLRYVRRPDFAS